MKPSAEYLFRNRRIHVRFEDPGEWVLRRESGHEIARYKSRASAVAHAKRIASKENVRAVVYGTDGTVRTVIMEAQEPAP